MDDGRVFGREYPSLEGKELSRTFFLRVSTQKNLIKTSIQVETK